MKLELESASAPSSSEPGALVLFILLGRNLYEAAATALVGSSINGSCGRSGRTAVAADVVVSQQPDHGMSNTRSVV
jgi:hypothetical protein